MRKSRDAQQKELLHTPDLLARFSSLTSEKAAIKPIKPSPFQNCFLSADGCSDLEWLQLPDPPVKVLDYITEPKYCCVYVNELFRLKIFYVCLHSSDINKGGRKQSYRELDQHMTWRLVWSSNKMGSKEHKIRAHGIKIIIILC